MALPLIERFRDRLPVGERTPVVSLGEGSTPLLRASRLGEVLGVRELWLKWEASNPTGSYKDRGMTVAVSKAMEEGAEAVICASTGNTAASAAAYAARAGIRAVVLSPAGAVSGAKVAQTRMLGAAVLEVRGDFDAALEAARELARRGTHHLVNSLNPHRREGQKTAVFEIVEELGAVPDALVIPYGGGGNTSSYAQGRRELGIDVPIVSVEAADRQRTLASAIRIGEPAHAAAVAEAGAQVVTVDDDE
ncbi:MAG: threonine synthase, partial [Gaiella sp.]